MGNVYLCLSLAEGDRLSCEVFGGVPLRCYHSPEFSMEPAPRYQRGRLRGGPAFLCFHLQLHHVSPTLIVSRSLSDSRERFDIISTSCICLLVYVSVCPFISIHSNLQHHDDRKCNLTWFPCYMVTKWNDLMFSLKEFSHYLLAHMLIEKQVCCPQNVSVASQQNSVTALT